MNVSKLFDFYVGIPRGDQLIGLTILIIIMTIIAMALYRLVLRNCVKDGIHPSVVLLSVSTFSISAFFLPMRFLNLLPLGGGWILLAVSILTILVMVQFLVKKIVPWVGGLILLIVSMVLVVEYSGMAI